MSTKIEFSYKDKNYVLEYNRNAIKFIEKQGFNAEKISEQPATMIELAFTGAFLKNHAKLTQQEVDEIYGSIKNKQELNATLINMIRETYETLFEDSKDEDDSKNIEWKIV
jgi:hypothetical protein